MKNRRLSYEQLESRTVPSTIAGPVTTGVMFADSACDVAFTLVVTDDSGHARTSFRTGERLNVNIMVDDCREGALGTFAAALDLIYDDVRAHFDKQVHFGPSFPNYRSGGCWTSGIVDELIAVGGITPTGAGQTLLAQLSFVATEPGELVFRTDPADDLPMNDVLVYGWDTAVLPNHIHYGATTITVSEDRSCENVEIGACQCPECAIELKQPSMEVPEPQTVGQLPSRLTNLITPTVPLSRSDSPGPVEEYPAFGIQIETLESSSVGRSRLHRFRDVPEIECLLYTDLTEDSVSPLIELILDTQPTTIRPSRTEKQT